MLRKEKCLEFVFEGRESSRVSNVLGEVVPDVRTKLEERAKAMSFAVEASEMKSGESGNGCKAAVVQKDKRGRTSD